jgi:ABC-type dipeptide/oligopeptide/nickel transport system permease component
LKRVDRFHFLIYRPLLLIPLLFGITLVSFVLIHTTPGEMAIMLLGNQNSADGLARLRSQYGLDHPLLLQYGYFVYNLGLGEFGRSSVYQAPVFSVVLERLWPTLFLIVYGAMLSMTIAIGLALVAARHAGRLIDRLICAYATAGQGLPAFWLGILLVFLLSTKLELFPSSGYGDNLFLRLHHLCLPALTIALALSPFLIRILRTGLVREMTANHVVAARSRGLPERAIFRKHVFLNALIPAVRLLGLNVGWLMGSTVMVEQVFGLPGLGGLIVGSILARDYLVVQAIAMIMALGTIGAKFVLDIATAAIDPRVKL